MDWQQKILQFIKNNKKGTLFLINTKVELERVADFFRKSVSSMSGYLIVCFNIEIPREFRKMDLNIKSSEDYLSRGDYKDIDDYVFYDASMFWYRYKDITTYRNIALGRMFEYEFRKYLMPRIKNLEIIKRIVAQSKVERVVVIEDADELINAAELYAGYAGIDIFGISFKSRRGIFAGLKLSIKSKITALFTNILDCFVFRRIIKGNLKKRVILIDAKLYKFFRNVPRGIDFLPCPLEKGLNVRFRLVKEWGIYLPFYFRKNKRYLKEWGIYRKKWQELSEDENFRNIFKYKDISIWEIVEEWVSGFFLEDIPRVISNINRLDRLLKARSIKNAVVRNDLKELERTIVFTLHSAKIPSLHLQHGVLAESNGDNILAVDKFAAWGKASIDWYAKYGNPPDKFVITGNSHFDMLKRWQPKFSRQELFERLHLDEAKTTVLFATQQINKFSSFWTDDLFLVMADKILNAMRKFDSRQLVIKADPYEDLRPYENMIKVVPYNNAAAVRDIDIYTLIYFSDIVITLDSTVALEAMVFDKPVITLNLTKRADRVPYAASCAALGVYRAEDISAAIENVFNDEGLRQQLASGRKKFIYDYAYKTDGLAKERTANLMCEMTLN